MDTLTSSTHIAVKNAAKKITGQVALVTDGAGRTGRAIALALAQRGWDVALHHRGTAADAAAANAIEREIAALGRRTIALPCDLALADEQAMQALLRNAAALGAVGCLVNNAALAEFDAATAIDPALLQRHMQVNLTVPLLLAQALHAATPEGAQAVVINLLDQKLYHLQPEFLSYTLSKAALHTATTLLAQALAPKLRVVGVAPEVRLPAAATPGQPERPGRPERSGKQPPDFCADIAAAVCYLAQASGVTGATMAVDGGRHLLLPKQPEHQEHPEQSKQQAAIDRTTIHSSS